MKNPHKQQEKAQNFNKLWHSEEVVTKKVAKTELYDYSNISSLALFSETHPKVMQQRVSAMDWDFEFDVKKKNYTLKETVLNWIERKTGKRLFEFKNYDLV